MSMPLVNARLAHLLSVHRMTAIKVCDGIAEESSSDNYDQVVFTQNVETIEAFSSHIVMVKAEKACIRGHINVMTQALWTGRWLFAAGPHHTKYIHRVEAR